MRAQKAPGRQCVRRAMRRGTGVRAPIDNSPPGSAFPRRALLPSAAAGWLKIEPEQYPPPCRTMRTRERSLLGTTDHSPGTPSRSTDRSSTSSATGQMAPTSSRRWRRAIQPTGRGFDVSIARTASISRTRVGPMRQASPHATPSAEVCPGVAAVANQVDARAARAARPGAPHRAGMVSPPSPMHWWLDTALAHCLLAAVGPARGAQRKAVIDRVAPMNAIGSAQPNQP